jgi:hypothetical protein
MGSASRRFRAPLAAALGILIAALALEVGARFRHEAPWYERLETEQQAKPMRRKLNEYGLRGPAHSGPKEAEARRILIIGDSFTFGDGVEDGSLVFPALLERDLCAGPLPAGVERVEILNGGIPGSHTDDWLELWHKVGGVFDPDVVIVVFFLRDGSRVSAKKGFFDPIRRDIVARNERSWLYQHSYAFRVVRDRLDRADVARSYGSEITRAYLGDESETEEWRSAQTELLELRDLAAEQGASVGFVVFPILVELSESYPFRGVCDLLASFARGHGMPTLDLLPAYLGHDATELWVSPMNQHANAAGHAIAARAMLPFVRGLLEQHERGM